MFLVAVRCAMDDIPLRAFPTHEVGEQSAKDDAEQYARFIAEQIKTGKKCEDLDDAKDRLSSDASVYLFVGYYVFNLSGALIEWIEIEDIAE